MQTPTLPLFVFRACALPPPPPSTFADTRFRASEGPRPAPVPTQSAARGSCAQVRGLASPTQPSSAPPNTARTRSRAPQVGPPSNHHHHHGPAWNPAPCPGRTSPPGSAEARRASMRPESRRRPRSPPPAAATAAGSGSPPPGPCPAPTPARPAGSQRHVTTGAAEGQLRARAGGRGRRAGRAGRGGRPRGPLSRPQRPLAGRAGARLRCYGYHRPDFFPGLARLRVSPTLVPPGERGSPGRPHGRPRSLGETRPRWPEPWRGRSSTPTHPAGPPLLRPPGPWRPRRT